MLNMHFFQDYNNFRFEKGGQAAHLYLQSGDIENFIFPAGIPNHRKKLPIKNKKAA